MNAFDHDKHHDKLESLEDTELAEEANAHKTNSLRHGSENDFIPVGRKNIDAFTNQCKKSSISHEIYSAGANY
jgi:hypothetical protein